MTVYSKKDLREIIDKLKNNELFILKTDTVYGIMALATRKNEIKINQFKKRSVDQKISIIFFDNNSLLEESIVDEEKKQFINDKLPGKYTLIVNLRQEFIRTRGFLRTDFGVRVTTYDFLQSIIKETGPLLATSCNLNKEKPCSNYEEIAKVFGNTSINIVRDSASFSCPSHIIDIRNEIKIIR